MKKSMPKFLLFVLAFFTIAAFAADLGQAKQDGYIGERADGYLGLVDQSAPADVIALVKDINAKRMDEYQRIAKENGISYEQVQALAGKKAIQRTAPGHSKLKKGGWQRK